MIYYGVLINKIVNQLKVNFLMTGQKEKSLHIEEIMENVKDAE